MSSPLVAYDLLYIFVSTFTTLLAIINPLAVLPIFLSITHDKDRSARYAIAVHASLYTMLLILFFFFFGTAILKIFGVPFHMVRIVGGIILTRIGFELFTPSRSSEGAFLDADSNANIALMPLAMPLMFSPGVIATMLGMLATIEKASNEIAAYAVILGAAGLAVLVTFLCLALASRLVNLFGRVGIDAITRIVGFFVSTMGVSLVFSGVMGALGAYGVKVVL